MDPKVTKQLTSWDILDIDGLLDSIEALWDHDYGRLSKTTLPNGDIFLNLMTGGWYDNEEIIRALDSHKVFNMLYWHASTRGGSHMYIIYEIKKTGGIKDE